MTKEMWTGEKDSNFELYRVQLPIGKRRWVGIIKGKIFSSNDDEKLATILEFCGYGTLTNLGSCMELEEFLSFAKDHSILSKVPDWDKMGINEKGDGRVDPTDEWQTIILKPDPQTDKSEND